MTHEEHLERFLRLCKRVYLRMEQDGTWPWPDSQKTEGMVESEDSNDV